MRTSGMNSTRTCAFNVCADWRCRSEFWLRRRQDSGRQPGTPVASLRQCAVQGRKKVVQIVKRSPALLLLLRAALHWGFYPGVALRSLRTPALYCPTAFTFKELLQLACPVTSADPPGAPFSSPRGEGLVSVSGDAQEGSWTGQERGRGKREGDCCWLSVYQVLVITLGTVYFLLFGITDCVKNSLLPHLLEGEAVCICSGTFNCHVSACLL